MLKATSQFDNASFALTVYVNGAGELLIIGFGTPTLKIVVDVLFKTLVELTKVPAELVHSKNGLLVPEPFAVIVP